MQIDVIVAGAGIWGCTVARVLAEAGRKVLVLEKRSAVGGNVRCETDPNGIEIHTYGAHIFHTHLDDVWDFVNRFITFNGYQHKVLARYEGKTYFLPLGLTLVNQFYGLNLTPAELPAFIAKEAQKGYKGFNGPNDLGPNGSSGSGSSGPNGSDGFGSNGLSGSKALNFEEQAISFIGEPLYRAFIREYTRKQWGTDPKNLPASIIKRLPVRASYDINYYSDYRQGIPLTGYNSLFDRLLDHPGIVVECNAAFDLETVRSRSLPKDVPVFYSGPIDALFGYRFGALPWRSLRFERETLDVADFQGTSVMNYTGADVPFTRIHEFKHFHPENGEVMARPKTVICREFPKTWQPGDEPYYAVDTAESRALLERYRAEAANVPGLVIGGRLGEYRYYDMDQSVGRGLAAAREFLEKG